MKKNILYTVIIALIFIILMFVSYLMYKKNYRDDYYTFKVTPSQTCSYEFGYPYELEYTIIDNNNLKTTKKFKLNKLFEITFKNPNEIIIEVKREKSAHNRYDPKCFITLELWDNIGNLTKDSTSEGIIKMQKKI